MKRKLKLKRNVKIMLGLTVTLIVFMIIVKTGLDRFEEKAKKCDNKLGRTCTYYEIMRNK